MWSYVLRRCLLMVPTFIGITAVAFSVMQMAGEHAYQKELMMLTGAGKGGEGSAGSSSGRNSGLSALTLEQVDRIRERYELHLPILFNPNPLDRSDRVKRALLHATAPMPTLDLGPLKALLGGLQRNELIEVITIYEAQVADPANRWNFEEIFINSFGGRLASLDGPQAAQVEAEWKRASDNIQPRRTWREERERAKQTLARMSERLIPALVEIEGALDDQAWSVACTALGDLGLETDIRTREDFRTFYQAHSGDFDEISTRERLERLMDLQEDSDKAMDLEDGIYRYKSCVAGVAYEALVSETDLKRIPRRIKLFERASGCDAIPYLEDPSETFVLAAVVEAKKWWRIHELEFVEMGPLRRAYSMLRETRYGRWLNDIAHLDFRESKMQSRPVMTAIAACLPVSITFGLVGFLLSYFVCIPLGVIKAVRHGTPFDIVSSALVFVGYSIPGWAFGFILLVIFGGGTFPSLDWFPLQGFQSDNYESMDLWHKILDRAHHAVLPVMAYSVGSFATLTVLMKNSLLENLGADYVRTAFAKGLSERRVIFVHTLRNSLIPLCTMMGHILSYALAGSYLVESVFNIQGFGLMGFNALQSYDINLMMGSLVIGAVLQLTGNLFSDLLYCAVDPRIRFS